MSTMKRIAMPALAALVLAACGGKGAPQEATAGGAEVAVVVGAVGVLGWLIGKSSQEREGKAEKQEVVLSRGDEVDVDIGISYENGRRSSKRLIVAFMNMTSGVQWIERYTNSASGRQHIRFRLANLETAGVKLTVRGRYR